MTPSEAPPAPPNGARAAWAIAPGTLLAGVAGGIAFPILPSVGQRVGLPIAFIGVILAANRAARVIANPFVGVVTDRIGGRRTLLLGLAIQIVVMALYWLGVTTSHAGAFFLAGRILHGPGSSCVFVAGQALALELAAEGSAGQAGGIVRGAINVGVPVGLVLGGVLADAVGEAATFGAAAGALVLATIGAYALVPKARVSVAERPTILRALGALRDRRLAAVGGLNFAVTFAGSGVVLTTLALLVHARHLALFHTPERATASLMMGLLVMTEAATMPLFGRVGDARAAHGWVAAIGVAVMVPALVVIAHASGSSGCAAGIMLLGAGVGALGPSVLALVGRVARPGHRGAALGAIQVCADIGGALGPLVGTAFFASSITLPYEVSAIVVALFIPAAIWLARVTARAPDAPVAGG